MMLRATRQSAPSGSRPASWQPSRYFFQWLPTEYSGMKLALIGLQPRLAAVLTLSGRHGRQGDRRMGLLEGARQIAHAEFRNDRLGQLHMPVLALDVVGRLL